jgi:AAA ATPase domain
MPTFPAYNSDLPTVLKPWDIRHHLLVAYWIFFKPTDLECYLYQIDSELYKTSGSLRNFLTTFKSPAYRRLYLIALMLPFWLSIVTGILLAFVAHITICRIGHCLMKYTWEDWYSWSELVILTIPYSVLGCFVGSFKGNTTGCVTGYIASGVTFGVMFNIFIFATPFPIAIGIPLGIAFGVVFGILFNVVEGIVFNVVLSILLGALVGFAFGIDSGIKAGITSGIKFGASGGIIFGVGLLRIPFYIIQCCSIFNSYFRQQYHPITWDERSVLPLPSSVKFSTIQLKKDELNGLKILTQQTPNEFQHWTIQKSLHNYLHSHHSPLSFFYKGLANPSLSVYAKPPDTSSQWTQFISRRKILLAEISYRSLDFRGNSGSKRMFSSKIAYILTKPLRDFQKTPITDFARLIYALKYQLDKDSPIDLQKMRSLYVNVTDYPYGNEIIYSLDTINTFLKYETLTEISTAPQEIRWLQGGSPHPPAPSPTRGEGKPNLNAKSPTPSPYLGEGWGEGNPCDPSTDPEYLRPTIIQSLQALANISIEFKTYQTSSSNQNKLAAIARATESLQQLSKKVDADPELPEAVLLRRIIYQWQQTIITAGGIEGRLTNIQQLVSPYTVGVPATSNIFVGREDIMGKIEALLGKAGQLNSILLHGHRRMGKTSILRNLTDRFGHDIIANFDMRSISSSNTSEFLYNIAITIYDALPNAPIPEPQRNDFVVSDPFTVFSREFLNKIESSVANRHLILTIDEFEIIDALIKSGQIKPEILRFFRSLIEAYPWLVIVFAGLHTLPEMTEAYWEPFFGSTRQIHVSFLSWVSAQRLIENPSKDFSANFAPEATRRIYDLTNGQAYLIQIICDNLIHHYNYQRSEERIDRSALFTLEDVEAVVNVPEFYRDGYAYFNGVWGQSQEQEGPAQIQILRSLCTQALTPTELAQATQLAPDKLQSALQILENHDIIHILEGKYQYTVELMRRWVEQKQPE